jgi:hypothetical protein
LNTVITTGDSTDLGIEAAVYLAERDSRADATISDLGRGVDLQAEGEHPWVDRERSNSTPPALRASTVR